MHFTAIATNNNSKSTTTELCNKQIVLIITAVEERRIVYVGRIEEETTKEDLRRKFLAYGSIKQITIHYKDNGYDSSTFSPNNLLNFLNITEWSTDSWLTTEPKMHIKW